MQRIRRRLHPRTNGPALLLVLPLRLALETEILQRLRESARPRSSLDERSFPLRAPLLLSLLLISSFLVFSLAVPGVLLFEVLVALGVACRLCVVSWAEVVERC